MIVHVSPGSQNDLDGPLVSVILPTYNRVLRTNSAVRSVLNQSFADFEVIVVDDCSDVHSVSDELAECKQERVYCVRHSQRRGGATARNTGIDNARGKFVAFLDSDDTWVTDKLERQIDFHLRLQNPYNSISYTGILYWNGSQSIEMRFPVKPSTEGLGEYLFLSWGKHFVHTSTILLSRDLANRVRFRDGLPIHQDWDFCLRAEHVGACFKVLPEPLTLVRAEPRADRVSGGSDVNASLRWVESVKELLSERAYVAFRAHQAPRLAHQSASGAMAMILRAFLLGAIGPLKSLFLLRWWARELMISRPYLRKMYGWYKDGRSLLGATRQCQ